MELFMLAPMLKNRRINCVSMDTCHNPKVVEQYLSANYLLIVIHMRLVLKGARVLCAVTLVAAVEVLNSNVVRHAFPADLV